jgi:hypothetical protein
MGSDGFSKSLIAGIVACLFLFFLLPALLAFPYWQIIFGIFGIPLLASALCFCIVAFLISKPFERGKLAVRLASWTLLLPLFFAIGLVGYAYIFTYYADLAHNFSFNFDSLNAFSSYLRVLFLEGLNFYNIALGAIWAFGLILFLFKEKRRDPTKQT